MFLTFLISAALCGFLSGCHSPKSRVVIPGFYFWKTRFKPDANENKLLKETASQIMYVRFFDVTNSYDENIFPVIPNEPIVFDDTVPAGLQIVPVVYIENNALDGVDTALIKPLAEKMRRKIYRMCDNNRIAGVKEYQLDCDWNGKTKAKYFSLISEFKKQVQPAKVSVTIRLHQYKYMQKSGIPPADRGMLMFYNMGNFKADPEQDYILNIQEAKKYLTPAHAYPLPLDIGLPAYSQAIISVNPNYIRLEKGETIENAIAKGWIKLGQNGRYTCATHECYEQGWADDIRYEKITPAKLLEAAKLVETLADKDTCRVVFFHLDDFEFRNLTAHDIKEVVHTF